MPQACKRTRWSVVRAFALAVVVFAAWQFTPQPGGAGLAFAQYPAPGQQDQHHFPTNPSAPRPPAINSEEPNPMSPKQKARLVKANFHKTQQDADQLFKLAQSLKEDLDKSNPDILSVAVVNKAKKIEKLAKKIKSEALNND